MNRVIRVFYSPIFTTKSLTHMRVQSIIDTQEYHKEKLKLSKIRAFLKEFMLLMVEGTKDTYRDIRWLI